MMVSIQRIVGSIAFLIGGISCFNGDYQIAQCLMLCGIYSEIANWDKK